MVADKFGRVDQFYSTQATMSIDKFGRHGISTSAAKPGIGFLPTVDGNYDMNNKLIRNVGAPKSSNDAVTKKYLESVALLKELNTNQFNDNQSLIRNVLPPLLSSDVVTKGFADNSYLSRTMDGHYSVDFRRLKKLRLPIEDSDAVNKEYVTNTLDQYCLQRDATGHYNAKGHRIKNVEFTKNPDPTDVVIRSFVDRYTLNRGGWEHSDFDAQLNRITNVGGPTSQNDTLKHFDNYALKKNLITKEK